VPTRSAALCLSVLCLATPAALMADTSDLAALPGGPPKRLGEFAVGPETGLVIPLSTKRLCPDGFGCIADVGWALGVAFSYRWKNGLGLGFGYEFWLLSANGVYETTVTQSFLGNLQYSFLPDRATHPLIRLRGGLLLLGPSFGVGAEVEIASDAAFSFLVTGNLLRTQSFVTAADDALRATTGALDAMLVLRLGFNFLL
jgi:hypothetical protein